MTELKKEQVYYEYVREKLGIAIEKQRDRLGHLTKDSMESNRAMMSTSNDFSDEDVRAEISQNLQTYAIQQSTLSQAEKKLIKYEQLIKKPYFGRFDFKEKGYSQEQCYVGIGNFMTEDTFEILVYDWRAPICTLFYEGEYGHLSYESPNGTVKGEVLLKRHYQITDHEVTAFYDLEEHPTDPVLLDVLSQKRGEKLYPVVQSIQKKQNEIIRMADVDLMEVHGVPGSGKSIIALHRMAYLLYHGKKTYDHQNMVILSPNNYFKQYIDGVLPELGESTVLQFTFFELMDQSIHIKYDYDRYMDLTLTGYRKANSFKSTRAYVDLLKRWLKYYLKHKSYQDVSFAGKIILTRQEIKNKLLQNMDKPLNIVLNQLRTKAESAISYETKQIKEQLIKIVASHKNYITDPEHGADVMLQKKKRVFYNHLKQALKIDASQVYHEFKHAPNDFIYDDGFEHQSTHYDDLYAKLLIKSWIEEHHKYKHVKYLLIDECQDYNAVQYELIKYWFRNAHVTVLGDINQTIHGEKHECFSDMITGIFKPDKSAKIDLRTCYRSTEPIVSLANQYLDSDMVSIGRHGPDPVISSINRSSLKLELLKYIDEPVTIITTTMSMAKKIVTLLEAYKPLLFHENSTKMDGEILVMPIFYAKGMEFDHVVYVRDDIDPRLQAQIDYTAITRAKHQITLLDLI